MPARKPDGIHLRHNKKIHPRKRPIQSPRAGRGGRSGPGVPPCRKRSRVEDSGMQCGVFAPSPGADFGRLRRRRGGPFSPRISRRTCRSRRHPHCLGVHRKATGRRVRRVGSEFRRIRTGRETEKLASRPAELAHQDFRFSGFHPSTCRPRIWLGIPGWGGGAPSMPVL